MLLLLLSFSLIILLAWHSFSRSLRSPHSRRTTAFVRIHRRSSHICISFLSLSFCFSSTVSPSTPHQYPRHSLARWVAALALALSLRLTYKYTQFDFVFILKFYTFVSTRFFSLKFLLKYKCCVNLTFFFFFFI